MEKIRDSKAAEAKVLRDMQEIVSKVKRLSADDVNDVENGSERLREIRSSVYEDLNQIQHEYLILRGLRWLLQNGFDLAVEWEWNPRQTGTVTEPDLRGSLNDKIVASAEASSSETPQGKVDERMKKTLEKLSQMDGQRFYFVGTEEMASRARTKLSKAGWSIRVVCV